MKKVILLILDGFGINNSEYGNAIKQARTPVIDKLLTVFPHAQLAASGIEVGLPKGQMGNSEVGHMTIGSGRVIYQSLEYINKKIIDKEAPRYTSRLIVRLTPQLHKEIAEYAALCGLTTSAYARKRLEGKYPKQRLTDKEMEALNSLSDARGDIQKLFGFLKGRPLTERENILRSEIFMKRWRTSAEVILNRMIEIEKYLTQ